jgi:hypothetical protein
LASSSASTSSKSGSPFRKIAGAGSTAWPRKRPNGALGFVLVAGGLQDVEIDFFPSGALGESLWSAAALVGRRAGLQSRQRLVRAP